MMLIRLACIWACAAVALAAPQPAAALERVANTPYTGSSNEKMDLRLPSCVAGEVLTSLGSNTFSCINTNDVLNGGNGGTLGLPTCGTDEALAVLGNKFVCSKVIKSAPNCAKGYALVGDGNQTLSCVKMNDDPPTCSTGQVLTTDQGRFVCVNNTAIPTCGAGQALTGQGGKLVCNTINATNCDGRVTQSWGGYTYCSNITCGANQVLTLVDGYLQCNAPSISTNIDSLLACQRGGMFYDPGHPNATSAGCVRSCGDTAGTMNYYLMCSGGYIGAQGGSIDTCLRTPGVTCCMYSYGVYSAFVGGHTAGNGGRLNFSTATACRSGGL